MRDRKLLAKWRAREPEYEELGISVNGAGDETRIFFTTRAIACHTCLRPVPDDKGYILSVTEEGR